MKSLKVNKKVIEFIKTLVIFGAIMLTLGFGLGDHYAHQTRVEIHTITLKG